MSHAPGRRGTPSRGQRSSARGEGVLRALLGEVPVAGDPDQGRDDPAPLLAERARRPRPRRRAVYISQIGLTSIEPCRAPGIFDRDLDRLVEVLAVDQVEAADLLLGLRERAVGGEDLAVADPHGGGVGGGPQPLAALEHAPPAHLLAEGHVLGHLRPAPLRGSSPCSAVSSVQIIST